MNERKGCGYMINCTPQESIWDDKVSELIEYFNNDLTNFLKLKQAIISSQDFIFRNDRKNKLSSNLKNYKLFKLLSLQLI